MRAQTHSHFPHIPPPVRVRLTTLAQRPCAYLPGQAAQMRAFAVGEIDPSIYQAFMDSGFRRSGQMIYQPVCVGCRECTPIRVAVDSFRPSRSQRRARAKNTDAVVNVAAPVPTPEKFAVYAKYQSRWHGETDVDYESYVQFLYTSPTRTLEFTHTVEDRVIGVGICDVTPSGLSSVYFYFDPDESRRSLGTYGALVEIDYARAAALPYYYLGYWVRDCAAMRYKVDYGPPETLGMDGVWRPLEQRMGDEG